MGTSRLLTSLQLEVATTFFELRESSGFVVAGGAALIASDLIARPTEDLDLFASAPTTTVTNAQRALTAALEESGKRVEVVQESATFARLVVEGAGEDVLVDLAVDSPPIAAISTTSLGPTLAPRELAGRKLLALFGRAEARDFADVYALTQRFDRETMLAEATALDPGFDRRVLAQMMGTLGRFADDEIPLPLDTVSDARTYFARWADELGDEVSAGDPGDPPSIETKSSN